MNILTGESYERFHEMAQGYNQLCKATEPFLPHAWNAAIGFLSQDRAGNGGPLCFWDDTENYDPELELEEVKGELDDVLRDREDGLLLPTERAVHIVGGQIVAFAFKYDGYVGTGKDPIVAVKLDDPLGVESAYGERLIQLSLGEPTSIEFSPFEGITRVGGMMDEIDASLRLLDEHTPIA